MRWKRRVAEIRRLRDEHAGNGWKVPFPDLSVEQRTAPCGCGFAATPRKKNLPKDARQFPVGNSHKQGPELITPGMMSQLEYLGGKKT